MLATKSNINQNNLYAFVSIQMWGVRKYSLYLLQLLIQKNLCFLILILILLNVFMIHMK